MSGTVPLMVLPGDELVEEVSATGEVLRVITRSEMRSARLRHRATFIAVHDGQGRVLVHQRSPLKDVWPSRWDIAAGGVAGVGEGWTHAAERELAEELGISAMMTSLGTDRYEDDDVKLLAAIFSAEYSGEVQFTDGEVIDARWVDRTALDEMLRSAQFCPDSLYLVLPRIAQLLGD